MNTQGPKVLTKPSQVKEESTVHNWNICIGYLIILALTRSKNQAQEFHFNHRSEQMCFLELHSDFLELDRFSNASALQPNTVNKGTLTSLQFCVSFHTRMVGPSLEPQMEIQYPSGSEGQSLDSNQHLDQHGPSLLRARIPQEVPQNTGSICSRSDADRNLREAITSDPVRLKFNSCIVPICTSPLYEDEPEQTPSQYPRCNGPLGTSDCHLSQGLHTFHNQNASQRKQTFGNSIFCKSTPRPAFQHTRSQYMLMHTQVPSDQVQPSVKLTRRECFISEE